MTSTQCAKHSVVELYARAADGDPRWGAPLPTVDNIVRSVDVIGPVRGEGLQLPGFTATPIKFSQQLLNECWELWSGVGNLQYVSPETFTEFPSRKTLEVIYGLDLKRESAFPLGSFERLDEYVRTYSPGRAIERELYSHYAEALARVPAGSIVNWQYYMFEGAMALFGRELKERGVIQSFHAHDPLPGSLTKSEWGRDFLQALSLMDVVYLHTDRYASNLQRQLEEMNLNIPLIRRFDLGIDRQFIENSLSIATAQNYRSFFDNYEALPNRQKETLREIFASGAVNDEGQMAVKHRFMCIDRLAAIKGLPTLLDGIDHFLGEKLASGQTMDDLRRDYRFFFIEDATSRFENDPTFVQRTMDSYNLGHRYIIATHNALQELKEKYPGVIWTGDQLFGRARHLLPLLMRGCHMMSGGAGEGLNLAVAEGAFANLDQDTTMLMGNNSGFTIRMGEVGLSDKGFFPPPKDPRNFTNALSEITHIAENYPGELRTRKAAVVSHILTRNDSVLTGGEEVLK